MFRSLKVGCYLICKIRDMIFFYIYGFDKMENMELKII